MVYEDLLRSEAGSLGLELAPDALLKLARYCEELQRWSKRMNLTALAGRDLVQRLVVEPVWIASTLEVSGSVVDIGSGNGSPAIPFGICRALDALKMVESRLRRAAFLRHLIASLGLRNAAVFRG